VARDKAWRVGAGTGHGTMRRSGCSGRRGVARCGIGAPPRGSLGRADGVVSRNERSEKLGVSVGCRSVDGVNRGKSVDGPVGPIAVLGRAQSRMSDIFKVPGLCCVALPSTNSDIATSKEGERPLLFSKLLFCSFFTTRLVRKGKD
jgi:hypothetical protein